MAEFLNINRGIHTLYINKDIYFIIGEELLIKRNESYSLTINKNFCLNHSVNYLRCCLC